MYADITSPSFRKFHKTISKTAKEGKSSYKLRHKPSQNTRHEPLAVHGYGVELQLKRTDYIVIDDRQAEEAGKEHAAQTTLEDAEVADLKPLSESELKGLGLKAGSFVMGSDDPLETLLRLSQDFPKHSSAIAAHDVSEEFLKEHKGNREAILPAGYNILWINGVQIMARDVDAFAMLVHLRRERQIINGVRKLGFSPPEAISILSNGAIAKAKDSDEPQRYDWRDQTEDGKVIMFMNNIEKDKRYAEWSESLRVVSCTVHLREFMLVLTLSSLCNRLTRALFPASKGTSTTPSSQLILLMIRTSSWSLRRSRAWSGAKSPSAGVLFRPQRTPSQSNRPGSSIISKNTTA